LIIEHNGDVSPKIYYVVELAKYEKNYFYLYAVYSYIPLN